VSDSPITARGLGAARVHPSETFEQARNDAVQPSSRRMHGERFGAWLAVGDEHGLRPRPNVRSQEDSD
jgi:hypothetical protein